MMQSKSEFLVSWLWHVDPFETEVDNEGRVSLVFRLLALALSAEDVLAAAECCSLCPSMKPTVI